MQTREAPDFGGYTKILIACFLETQNLLSVKYANK